MVQLLPLVGVAALFAQSALAAAVPARRTYDSGSSYNSNSYNSGNSNVHQDSNQYGSSNYNSGSNSYNSGSSDVHQQSSNQDSNQYGSKQYGSSNSYNSGSNSYNSGDNNVYQQSSNQDSNQYGSSNNYDSSSNQYNNNNAYTSVMAEETSVMQQDISTTTASYSMPSYGSGSSNGNSGYNNCVQQCMAQFGSPPSSMESQASLPPPSGGGATHTIYVAPDQHSLRYLPFAVNASVGDTLTYVWTTPINHTVTHSSALNICNKSSDAAQLNFVSGIKNAAAGIQTFNVTVQSSDTQFYYCGVPNHCEQGMFGMVNPSSSLGSANTTVGTMMSSLMESNPSFQATYNSIMANVSSTSAQNWGNDIPMTGFSQSQYLQVAANVLFTRVNLDANPGMLDGSSDGSPIQVVSLPNALFSNTSTTSSSAPSESASESGYAVVPTSTGSIAPANAASGALSTRSVSTWVAAIVGIAGWLLI